MIAQYPLEDFPLFGQPLNSEESTLYGLLKVPWE